MIDEHVPTAGTDQPESADRVRAWIERRQRTAYRDAAHKLDLGDDPEQAWRRLTGSGDSQEADATGTEALWNRPGWDQMNDSQRAEFEAALAASKLRDGLPLPTRFEHRRHYRALNSAAEALLDVLHDTEWRIEPPPVIATMPTGDVNARASRERTTKTPVIFFDQGLSEFLVDFARIIGWAMPSLGPEQLFDDHALTGLQRSYTMPPQASMWLSGALRGYVMWGTPVLQEDERVPVPPHNQFACVTLHMLMLQFIVGHELGHFSLGHMTRTWPSKNPWRDEYHADEFGAFTTARRLFSWSGSAAAAFWAVDLALSCLHLLHKAMSVVAFTTAVKWVSRRHPDELSRRQQQRALVGEKRGGQLAGVTVDGYSELLGMSDALLRRIATLALLPLAQAREEGKQPSALWRRHINAIFAAADGERRGVRDPE